jgi:hypothetical protein
MGVKGTDQLSIPELQYHDDAFGEKTHELVAAIRMWAL